jgi:hypothetical protein
LFVPFASATSTGTWGDYYLAGGLGLSRQRPSTSALDLDSVYLEWRLAHHLHSETGLHFFPVRVGALKAPAAAALAAAAASAATAEAAKAAARAKSDSPAVDAAEASLATTCAAAALLEREAFGPADGPRVEWLRARNTPLPEADRALNDIITASPVFLPPLRACAPQEVYTELIVDKLGVACACAAAARTTSTHLSLLTPSFSTQGTRTVLKPLSRGFLQR